MLSSLPDRARPVQRRDRPRERACAVLREAEQGAFADRLLEEARRDLDGRDRAFLLELVYGVLRNRTRIDWLLDRYSAQPVDGTDAWTRNILRLAAYQILFLDKVPPSAAVDTATELAKRHGRKPGYVNGLLRTIARNKNTLPLPDADDPAARLSILYSHPLWLVQRWIDRFGIPQTEEALRRNNLPAPLCIRTNTLKGTRSELAALLTSQGATVRLTGFSPVGLEVLSSPGITALQAYQDGWFMVQDEAAQLVGLLVAPRPGDTVLDACAAPGGKATHLAEQMQNQGSVVALDNDQERIRRIEQNTRRLGITIVRPLCGDAAAFRGEGLYDRVLIDAPCSGLGVLRRHPDGRWTKTLRSIREKRDIQQGTLQNCASMAKPGGCVVYSTCSTENEENEDIINHFLRQNTGHFALENPLTFIPSAAHSLVDARGFFRTFPTSTDVDGFFAARLIRKQ